MKKEDIVKELESENGILWNLQAYDGDDFTGYNGIGVLGKTLVPIMTPYKDMLETDLFFRYGRIYDYRAILISLGEQIFSTIKEWFISPQLDTGIRLLVMMLMRWHIYRPFAKDSKNMDEETIILDDDAIYKIIHILTLVGSNVGVSRFKIQENEISFYESWRFDIGEDPDHDVFTIREVYYKDILLLIKDILESNKDNSSGELYDMLLSWYIIELVKFF